MTPHLEGHSLRGEDHDSDSPKTQVEPPLTPVSESTQDDLEGRWRVQGDTTDAKGKRLLYEVTLHLDGAWECSCPSRENPCKHARDIALKRARAADMMPTKPAPNPTRPERRSSAPPRPSFNTNLPSGGVMVGGGEPPAPEPDPWAAPAAPKERVIGVGGSITFGTSKKK
jgi:hypothetical protein